MAISVHNFGVENQLRLSTFQTSRFKSLQKHYHENKSQSLNPVIQAVGAPYEYILKSYDNPPYMRFVIPCKLNKIIRSLHYSYFRIVLWTQYLTWYCFSVSANISVLDWWFKDHGPNLLRNQSLIGKLELTDDMKIWTITLRGKFISFII